MSKKQSALQSDLLSQLEKAVANAEKIERRGNNYNSYWHKEAARLRQLLSEVKKDGKLEQ